MIAEGAERLSPTRPHYESQRAAPPRAPVPERCLPGAGVPNGRAARRSNRPRVPAAARGPQPPGPTPGGGGRTATATSASLPGRGPLPVALAAVGDAELGPRPLSKCAGNRQDINNFSSRNLSFGSIRS
ncbi:PREDICTED: translation initiation factor IF-2-like [Chinchilla lanigera]|uniref:translation initiation factor IF-2-like n=1 Tax=Chinchilla lanigera TaxID=34839 RepID=UPI000698265D|nr:PREDICTED: translation initiation factor IF-2-like [Chinchilla lanigera]